jgi:enamine deaminase RidA (YjgF/YER057c/UK114 family)
MSGAGPAGASEEPGPPQAGPPSPHGIVNPASLAPPVGFSHAVVAAPGRTVYLAGQVAAEPDGRIAATGVAGQLDLALANLLAALAAADGRPEHLVWMQIFVTDVAAYRAELRRLGEVWRRHLGRHYVATALLEVRGLFDPAAMVELMGIAVIPEYR